MQPIILYAMNHGIFWSQQSHLVKVFLEITKKRAAADEKALRKDSECVGATPHRLSDAEVGAGLTGKNLLASRSLSSSSINDSFADSIEEKMKPIEPTRQLALFNNSAMKSMSEKEKVVSVGTSGSLNESELNKASGLFSQR